MSLFSHLKSAALSDVGKKRKNNEDAYGAFPEAGVFCVADGMGGGDDGEIASAAVVRAVEETVTALKPGEAGGFAARDIGAVLARKLSKASAWICHRAHERKLNGCGSTFVGVVFDATDPAQALAVHAGDSRLYLQHGRSLVQITRDHSVAELMGEKDESKVNPMFRSMVVNGIGIRSKADPEFTPFKVAPGDRVILCSDGLSRMVPDKKILAISRAEAEPKKAVRALIAAALEAGGIDNVTAVMVEVGKFPPPVLRLGAPPVSESESEDKTLDEMTTGGRDTGVTGGTMTSATMLPDVAEEAPFGIETPVDVVAADGAALVGEGEPGEEDTAERSESPRSAPRRSRGHFVWILALVAVVVGVAVALKLWHASAKYATVDSAAAVTVTSDAAFAAESNAPLPAPMPEMASNKDWRVATSSVSTPVAPDVPVGVLTNNPPVDAASHGVVVPPSPQTSPPTVPDPVLSDFVAVCAEKPTLAFLRALRRLGSKEEVQSEYFKDEKMRFWETARRLTLTRGAREAEATAVDLRVLILNAESVRTTLALRRTETGVSEILSDWNTILLGNPAQESVQSACVRLMRALPGVRTR